MCQSTIHISLPFTFQYTHAHAHTYIYAYVSTHQPAPAHISANFFYEYRSNTMVPQPHPASVHALTRPPVSFTDLPYPLPTPAPYATTIGRRDETEVAKPSPSSSQKALAGTMIALGIIIALLAIWAIVHSVRRQRRLRVFERDTRSWQHEQRSIQAEKKHWYSNIFSSRPTTATSWNECYKLPKLKRQSTFGRQGSDLENQLRKISYENTLRPSIAFARSPRNAADVDDLSLSPSTDLKFRQYPYPNQDGSVDSPYGPPSPIIERHLIISGIGSSIALDAVVSPISVHSPAKPLMAQGIPVQRFKGPSRQEK